MMWNIELPYLSLADTVEHPARYISREALSRLGNFSPRQNK